MTNKQKRIQWTNDEYLTIFKTIDNYIKVNKDFPSCSDSKAYRDFQVHLSKDRQKSLLNSNSGFYNLKTKYFVYLSNKETAKAFVTKTEQALKPFEPVKNVLTPPAPNVYHPKLSDINLESFIDIIDAKLVTLYAGINELIKDSNDTLPQRVIDLIMSKDTTVKESPIVVESPAPEPVIIPVVEKLVETFSNKDAPKIFSEAEIRKMIREEIESIFGPIKEETKKAETKPEIKDQKEITSKPNELVVEQKKTLEVLVGHEYKTIELKEKEVNDSKEAKSVYIYGLDSSKLQIVKKYFKDHHYLTIEGIEYMNHDVKYKAKNTDLIIVTKFSSHQVVESLKTMCDLSKIEFVQGGLTSIKNKIKLFLGETV